MRTIVAYFLIAITLLSNGMVDFAVKVCHDSNLNVRNEIISPKSEFLEVSNSPNQGSNPQSNFQNSKNRNKGSHVYLKQYSQKKKKHSCCAPESETQNNKRRVGNIQYLFDNKRNPNGFTLARLLDWFTSVDQHPCCVVNSKVQYKCCTLFNLYYFTPKFLEENYNGIPHVVWQSAMNQQELIRFQISSQLNSNHSEIIDRSDQNIPYLEDIASHFCVWII